MENRMLKAFGIAAGLMLSSQAFAQAQSADEWTNSASDVSTVPPADIYEEAVAEHSNSLNFEGMGGPIEERTGYPPCKPDPAADNCIQLYEDGVTGSRN